MIDYIAPIYRFTDKIFHVHIKDIKLYRDRLEQVGVMAYPLDFMSPKLPGLGDVDWGKYISALTDVGSTAPSALRWRTRPLRAAGRRCWTACACPSATSTSLSSDGIQSDARAAHAARALFIFSGFALVPIPPGVV